MTEIIVPPAEIQNEVRDYGDLAFSYAYSQDIPDELLVEPDHVMFKSSSPADFNRKCKQINGWSEELYFLQVDERFLVAARLLVPLSLSDKKVSWVEVMEPKSLEGTADYLGAEYVEFYYRSYARARNLLDNKQVHYTHREDDNHRWLNIRLNRAGQELRITDRPLRFTIDAQVDAQIARSLIP